MISAAAERTMRALILALVLVLTAAPALALTVIPPEDCRKHLGEIVTVEGTASEVYTATRSGVTFINMGGLHPNESFTGVIFKDDAGKFSNVHSLTGKAVDITGRVQDYRGRREIILNDPAQLKVK
jgi:DNA/RNA endonuclease YhcR with UshA esterase domain